MAKQCDNERPLPRTLIRDRHILLAALKPGAMAIVMVVAAFHPDTTFTSSTMGMLLTALVPPLLGAIAIYYVLEWWNGRTTVTEEGLQVTDWRGRQVQLPWGDIRTMWMGVGQSHYWLKIELPGDGPKPQMVHLLSRPKGAQDFEQVHDTIVARAGLVECLPAGTKKRVWRRV